MGRHSKIQLQVLSLYKQFLRLSRQKPGLDDHIRSEFKKNARDMSRTDILHVEHALRRGQRQLKMFQGEQVKGMDVFTAVEDSDKK
ncbi:Succinate dehydrogenase assembly factor 1, mitochondrial [Mizuhopecten yessoensis]|uniref:Succinate dehydrogenase assembly factor 1, mitochondrial n=1 Tax=Mizuhopecten yessoensis TaxID=6573 RepID=A0A210PXJ8_MIZYE|nr:Succinate dehydrogenase assembly factor 1, mitochondrial [Mizuhopecten yessoensis]